MNVCGTSDLHPLRPAVPAAGLGLEFRTHRELAAEVSVEQGLVFAGWDVKLDREGRYWCLECNPMPGYSCYDRVGDGAISDALIKVLSP